MVSASEPRHVFIHTYVCVHVCVCIYMLLYAYIYIYAVYMLMLGHDTFTSGTQGDISSLDYTLTMLGPETSLALKPLERNRSLVTEVLP